MTPSARHPVVRSSPAPLLALLLATLVVGCGGSDGPPEAAPPADDGGDEPAATQPDEQPPPGFPRTAASGTLADGRKWKLTETGLGQVCIRVSGSGSPISECTEITATWLVTSLRVDGSGTPHRILYAALPCGVESVELVREGTRIDGADTVARDDVTYVTLLAPATLAGVELVARGRTGAELFRLGRLGDDPSSRVQPPGC